MSKSRANSGVLAVFDHDARVSLQRQIETSIPRLDPRGSPLLWALT